MTVSQDNLDLIVEQAGELYTLPRVAMQVLELTREPTIDAWKLKQCIELDPALSAKLLRVVNSALFGLSRSVADLNQALAILGTKPLKLLVLGFSLPEKLYKNVAREVIAHYWQRTLIKAVAARQLAESVPHVCGDEAFIAALLQDIGSLVLIQRLGPEYGHLLSASKSSGDQLLLQRRTLGFDHTQLSARLLEQWQLPAAIVAAATLPTSGDEFTSELARRQPLRQIVYMAHLLVEVLLTQRQEALQELLEAGRGWANLDQAQLANLVDVLAIKVPELAKVLSLDLPEKLAYGDLLTQAYAQLTPVADGAAAELVALARQAALRQAEELCQATKHSKPVGLRQGAPSPHAVSNSAAKSSNLEADARLAESVHSAIAACRQRRAPLSLLAVQINEATCSQDRRRAHSASLRLAALCRDVDSEEFRCHEVHDGVFALLLANCHRQQAVRIAQQLLDCWRKLAEDPRCECAGLVLGLGLAAVELPPRNFTAQQLLAGAARCLSGAQASGGNCLKSIEL